MENGKHGPAGRIIRPPKIHIGVPTFICCLFLKDMYAKGDLDVKFHDDDNILAAIPDPLTKPRSSPSHVTSTVTTNQVKDDPRKYRVYPMPLKQAQLFHNLVLQLLHRVSILTLNPTQLMHKYNDNSCTDCTPMTLKQPLS